MSAIQLQETKRAFFAGLSQMVALFVELDDLPEESSFLQLGDINNQIIAFWCEQMNNTDNRKKG